MQLRPTAGRPAAFSSRPARAVRRQRAAIVPESLEPRRLFAAEYISYDAANPALGGNLVSEDASVSADGRYVAFASNSTNLVAGFVDGNAGGEDIYVRDRQTNAITLVSHAANSTTSGGNAFSRNAKISADGRFVAFASEEIGRASCRERV